MAQPKSNIEAQERVVSALWNFARELRRRGLSASMDETDFTSALTRAANGRSEPSPVRTALVDILDAFNCRVVPID